MWVKLSNNMVASSNLLLFHGRIYFMLIELFQHGIKAGFMQWGLIFFWSDILSSTSAKSGILCFLQLLQFGITLCFCNYSGISSSLQFLQFGIYVQFLRIHFVFWCNRITSRRYLFSFYDFYSIFAIWYFVFCCFCILVLCDSWLWLLKDMICFSLWVWGWMRKTICIGVM